MSERTAKRKYRESELPMWFRRVSKDWECHFRQEELDYGRALYKAGCIREVELNKSEAFITARLQDGSEPFCIIDFDGDEFTYIPSTSDDFLYGALKVAGFYEIEEFVIDRVAESGIDTNAEEEIVSEQQPNIEEIEVQTSEPTRLPADENAKVLALNFSSKRKGLVFEVFWKDKVKDKRIRAFGDKAPPVEELLECESELLMRLITMARKAGFKFDDNYFILDEIPKISLFLKSSLSKWKELFVIRKDKQVDLLMLGERKIVLSAKATSSSEDSNDFDIEWLPTVDGKAINRDDISKIFNGNSSVQIIPDYGIISISNKDSTFVKNVERARSYGFSDGKIPKYMLLAIADFGENLMLSDDLQGWVDTLLEKDIEADFSSMEFLRNYQKKAILWAVNLFKHGCNAMIADEMGLGKTIQTLGIFNLLCMQNDEPKKFLVVCPASVIPVWVAEAHKFFPKFKTQILTSKTKSINGDILISSYTQLRRNKATIDNEVFEVAVLDEAQFIKNPDSKTTVSCSAIKAKYKLALTGTPVENRLLDMWTSFRWLMPGLMGSRKRFEEIAQNSSDSIKLIRKQISPFILRRLKSEVARELPEKIYIDLLCPMSDFQKSEYSALLERTREELEDTKEDETMRRFTVLSLLTRLRQACCDSRLLPWVENSETAEVGGKITVLSDRVHELLLSGKKVLIFSQFTKFLSLIEENLIKFVEPEKIFRLTGSTRDRSKPVEMFQNAKEGVVMLVSLRAGGTGITLTNADYVFLADPWWNPAVEDQAIDRVHRIGRRGDVFVYRLVSQNTVEDRVRQLQEQKKGVFNQLLGDLKDVSNKGKFIETIKDILAKD
ncbi:MAG: DEAD/DEAH box helicase [Opitutales bacterium]|nr:DEAD/DEAH box helicase [Opitutales bacterium]